MSKIIVVDDEAGIRKLCYDLFTKDGHEVITLPRGDQIFEMIRTEKPDLILLDIEVPGEEGLSLFNRMPREKGKCVPVVILSGDVTPEIEKDAMGKGAIDVISKGIGGTELRSRINKILSSKRRLLNEPTDDKKETILVVDDEEGIRNFLSAFFQRKGFKVLTAKNGEEALLYVKNEKPAMVLLDVTMPGMDGILTLKKIREIAPDIGVVMATGLQDAQIAKEATELGAYAYVVKPFDMKYLELVVLTRLVIAA